MRKCVRIEHPRQTRYYNLSACEWVTDTVDATEWPISEADECERVALQVGGVVVEVSR